MAFIQVHSSQSHYLAAANLMYRSVAIHEVIILDRSKSLIVRNSSQYSKGSHTTCGVDIAVVM